MNEVSLIINDTPVTAQEGWTILQAARSAGIYIPSLCAHVDLPPTVGTEPSQIIFQGEKSYRNSAPDRQFEGCQLCVVEVEGKGIVLSCITPVTETTVVHADTADCRELRQKNLAKILANHPHACLICHQKEGCSLTSCSMSVIENERCCLKFNDCELRKIAEYIGIPGYTPKYTFQNLPAITDEPLFIRDYNLCVGCLRCVKACQEVTGVGALGFVFDNDKVCVGNIASSLEESGCKFCGVCIEVCSTGALVDKGIVAGKRKEQLVPCHNACPGGIDVPQYIRLIREEKLDEAVAVIREKVPFPLVLGYVCSHPCEVECRRGEVNEPIAIQALKRYAAEQDKKLGDLKAKVAQSSGRSVAIVGSGPAGLTAAYFLAKLGHAVTVYEALGEVGGMLRVGIPGYRLHQEALQKDLEWIFQMKVAVKLNTPIGPDLKLSDLKNQGYDAVFIATGAHLSRELNIEGVAHEGVFQGVYLLKDWALGKLQQDFFSGDRVVVIGGGNVAIDAARTALRLGANEVQLACLESREEMPAHEWEIDEAVEEGVILNCSWGPKLINGDSKVKGLELMRCTSVFNSEGRFNPSFDSGVETSIEADKVIIAIGQSSDLSFVEGGIEVTEKGTIKANPITLETDVKGIFVGGDVTRGPASVIEAIADGRKAAQSIDKYLGGEGIIDEALTEATKPNLWLGREEGFAYKSRAEMPCLPAEQRCHKFMSVELGLAKEMAIQEAKRCLQCDLRLQILPPAFPPEKWLKFEASEVSLVPETEGVVQLLDEEKKILYIKGIINMREELEEQLIENDKARYFLYEEDQMYTKRESELIQQFLQQHGQLPPQNLDLDDLF